jgi:aryl-alcohol dehydrogenase-like predicted oxidoreductase
MLRQRPSEHFFAQAANKNVGIIVRVPLASGLLTGKFSAATTFGKDDHRNFNRNGEAFDKGETFSGVNYETGLAAVEAIKQVFPQATNLSAIALKWILMFSEVSCVIPGASSPEQINSNISASEIDDLPAAEMAKVKAIYVFTYF